MIQPQPQPNQDEAFNSMSIERKGEKPLFPQSIQDVPAQYRLALPINQQSYLVSGKLERWTGATDPIFSPICLDQNGVSRPVQLGTVPSLTKEQAKAAVTAATEAYGGGLGEWPSFTSEERIKRVEGFVSAMEKVRDEVVNRIMWEIGKTLPDARTEFDRTVTYIRQSIDALRELNSGSESVITRDGISARVAYGPRGVTLAMGPSNYPLNETFQTLIPALLMGNTAIFKPPRLGVLLFEPLLPLFKEHFPSGVVNVVYGKGEEVIAPIIQSGKLDLFLFIGGTNTADALIKNATNPHKIHLVFGLAAKNVGIVLPSADIKASAKESVKGALSYNGQRCTALKRLAVHESVADEYVQAVVDEVNARKPGMPWENGVSDTPLPELSKIAYFDGLVQDAVAKGATVVNPGGGTSNGTYFKPAVLYPVTSDMRIFHEEQFGPVVPITTFTDVKDVYRDIASDIYNQGISVFSSNPAEIDAMIPTLRNLACRININSQCQRGPDILPFSARKSSGLGTLSILHALKETAVPIVLAGKEGEFTAEVLKAADF